MEFVPHPDSTGPRIAALWAQYGPYHFARMGALERMLGMGRAHAVEIAARTQDYGWNRAPGLQVITLCKDAVAEGVPFRTVFRQVRQKLAELRIEVCFLPSYFPKQSLAALMAAKSLGLKTVMMNESHAGTARAKGLSAWIKRRLIGLFDAALVGGIPHRRYFISMGVPADKVFTGYDAVDNDYFARRAEEVRSKRSVFSTQYDLPKHYFLSLGRLVPKKNLETLVRAYRKYLDASPLKQTDLVMVGSGQEETRLRCLCHELGLPVYEKSADGMRSSAFAEATADRSECGVWSEKDAGRRPEAAAQDNEIENRKSKIANGKPGVHFYGFRQIEENPVFYALADAFILPSLHEEWGLVVNEAMASSLPVIVSETAGCVEDLLEPGWPVLPKDNTADLLRNLGPIKSRVRKNGFVFNPRSREALAGALLAIRSVPGLQRAMGDAGRRIVEKCSCENFARNALMAARAALGEKPVGEVDALPSPIESRW
jgi:glycosyltransferase involved in cell wall biosynthesis